MRNFILILFLFCIFGCGGGGPKTYQPGEQAFDAANSEINSKADGIAYGNTEEAVSFAQLYSEQLAIRDAEEFEGGDAAIGSDEFLTYCRLNEKSIVFLVQVPKFKRYKDEVRDYLLEIAWEEALEIIDDHPAGDELEIVIGLRGALLYGGSAIGKANGTPAYRNEFSVGEEAFYPYFVDAATTSETEAASPSESSEPTSGESEPAETDSTEPAAAEAEPAAS